MRIYPLLSAFAATLIALSPVQAFAQQTGEGLEREHRDSVRDRARPDYDPAGMRFGGFDFNASVDFAATHTDNLFAAETNEQEDTYFTVSPRARLASHWSRHALAADAGASFNSHQDVSSEDATTGYAGLYGRYDISARTNVFGSARIAHDVEPRTDPDAPLTGDPVEYDRTDLSAGVQHTFNRFRATGSVSELRVRYDNAQEFRDFDQTTLRGRLEAEVSPRFGVLFEASADNRDYNNTPALNSDGQTYLVGATINLTDLMRGEIAVGQFNRDYDSGESTEGLAISSNLEWYITRLTTLSFNAHRNTEDVVGATVAVPYVETEVGARVDHELLRNVILTAGIQGGTREYDIIDRNDDYSRFDVGADYLLNRRAVIRARYQHDEVESSGADRYRDYEINAVTLGLTLRL